MFVNYMFIHFENNKTLFYETNQEQMFGVEKSYGIVCYLMNNI